MIPIALPYLHHSAMTDDEPYITVLLALTPLLDETQLKAGSHKETLKHVLTVHGKSIENVA